MRDGSAHQNGKLFLSEPLLRAEELRVRFGGVTAVSGVTFGLRRGEILSIVGPNGAGKTSIFNCISGLSIPDRGRILYDGRDITRTRPHMRARLGIARTFQNIELFPRMITIDNVLLGRHIHMKTGLWTGATFFRRSCFAAREEAAHRRRTEQIMGSLGLMPARNHPVGSLPYGTRKLVELARALALDPRLLLLDEPFGGLTDQEKAQVTALVKDMKKTTGVSVLLIEHDMDVVMDLSDRILAVSFGRPIAEGPPEAVLRHPQVVEAFLGREQA